jgi:4-diphosphocytidyl-2-C-methyl-D-erythritol kinase
MGLPVRDPRPEPVSDNQPAALRLDAPAKLNLSLAVTGRRADGFHELAGRFVLIDLADRLLLMSGGSGLRIDGAGPDVPVDARNLAWRGLVAGVGGEPELACLTLEKQIPSAAGLGGGSSDAAAAWRLGRRWTARSERPSALEFTQLAGLGADVPFFAAQSAAAAVSGIGEVVEPVPTPDPPLAVTLIHPPFRLPTAAVFAELRPAEWTHSPVDGTNDLYAAAARLRPELDDLVALVTAAGGRPQLSGSGPTLFVATQDIERADGVAARLGRAGVRVTRTQTRRAAASIEPIAAEE